MIWPVKNTTKSSFRRSVLTLRDSAPLEWEKANQVAIDLFSYSKEEFGSNDS